MLVKYPMERKENYRWKALQNNKLLWEHWDGDYLVFNPFSGQTHILNSMAAEALKNLEGQALTTVELAERLSELFAIASNQDLQQHVERLLNEFDELGLTELDRL